jgi:hypothetical protein
MEYLFLIYADPQRSAPATPDERLRAMEKHWAIIDDATQRGMFRSAAPLEPVSKAVTVRNNGGTSSAIDGPFAETKEHLGGYYLLDCASVEEARGWAERISLAVGGAAVEVRGVGAVPARPAHA